MEFDRKKNLRSFKFLALRELLLTLGFFACYIVFLTLFVEQATIGLQYAWTWRIFFLVCAAVCLLCCRFEVHLLTPGAERFLGYKAYIIHYGKWLYLGLSALTSYITVTYVTTSYLFFVLINLIWVVLYYALFVALTFKYRSYLMRGYVLISYLQAVKEWWKEGKMPPPPPKPEQPPKEKKQKPEKPERVKKPKKTKVVIEEQPADTEPQPEEQTAVEQPAVEVVPAEQPVIEEPQPEQSETEEPTVAEPISEQQTKTDN